MGGQLCVCVGKGGGGMLGLRGGAVGEGRGVFFFFFFEDDVCLLGVGACRLEIHVGGLGARRLVMHVGGVCLSRVVNFDERVRVKRTNLVYLRWI